MSQVHHHFKVFAGAEFDAVAQEVEAWSAGGGSAPKSIGIEYVEAAGKLLLSVGYRDDEPGYPVRLHAVSLGTLGDLDAGSLDGIGRAMSEASRQFDRVVCHELYVTADHQVRMVFMVQGA